MRSGHAVLSVGRILAWARDHRRRTGVWPADGDGPVVGMPCVTWREIDRSLLLGRRGLPGGDSLTRLLGRRLGARTEPLPPPLALWQIIRWADRHRRRTGRWPTAAAGPVEGVPGESWQKVDRALRDGRRGLPGGDSLSRLLHRYGRGPTRGRPRREPAASALPAASAARR
jgi:hypothetical protein